MSTGWMFFGIVYALYWVSQGVAYAACRSGSAAGQRLARFFWNNRIDLFQRRPFSTVLEAMEGRRFWLAASLVMLVNVRMVVLQWVLGMVFLAPLLAVVSGAMAGALFSLGERRTVFPYGMINVLFEWGAFAAGGPVFFGIKGIPPLDAVRNQRYL